MTVLWRCHTVLIHFQSPLGHCYESVSYDLTSVLMQSCLRTSESDVLCLYKLLCLVVTKKCKYGEIKLVGKKILVMEKSDECGGCRRYLGYLNHENTNVYNYKFNN